MVTEHATAAVLDLWITLHTCVWITSSSPGPLDRFLESRTSSCEPCLDCSGGHSEEICRFANAQAIDGAELKRSAQNGRQPRCRTSECFRNLSLAIPLFGSGPCV